MTDALKGNLPRMLLEDEQMVVALHRLVVTAQGESRLEIARFAEQLKVHLALEEQVLSPAALVLGEYVRRRLRTLRTAWDEIRGVHTSEMMQMPDSCSRG